MLEKGHTLRQDEPFSYANCCKIEIELGIYSWAGKLGSDSGKAFNK